jgi:photosystem II stability/assembly factor-like uncharacterized protein
MSSNGKYQSVTVPDSNFIWTSNDYGHSWIQKITAQNFLGVIISSDGNIQTALGSNGYIFASSDYGNTWIQQATFQNWSWVAMSQNGKIQTAIAYDGYIWRYGLEIDQNRPKTKPMFNHHFKKGFGRK